MIKLIVALPLILVISIIAYFLINSKEEIALPAPLPSSLVQQPSQSPITQQIPIPSSHTIPQRHHTFQTFNNCGPAALSMMLSYWDVQKSQLELGQKLRPFQNPQGDNDDKSVTLEELAKESENLGLVAFHRPNGDVQKIKKLIANDIPVVTRTLLVLNDDIGHYRVVRGFTEEEFIQDDSLQAANSRYSHDEFLDLWQPYNYEYLVAVPKDKEEIVLQILGEEKDPNIAWQNAQNSLIAQLEKNPNDTFAQFNLSNTLYHLGKYQESIDVFEKVQNRLTFRTLWYQIEPILAYKAIGNYQKVFEITDQILNNHNRAFSELYILRGDIYLEQGDTQAANSEYEKAVFYNRNQTEAKEKLDSLEL